MPTPTPLGVHHGAHPFHMDLSRESKPALREPWMALYIPFGSRPRYRRIRLGHMADDLRGLQPHALLGALGHALCALPRYGGQTPAPYSVGAHSLALALYTLRASFSPIATPQTHSISYPDAMFAIS
jgi:hypothetical protein